LMCTAVARSDRGSYKTVDCVLAELWLFFTDILIFVNPESGLKGTGTGFRDFLVKRILQCAVTILAVIVINFFLFRIMPGDPARMLMNPRMKPEVRDYIRAQFGLDKPLMTQFVIYLTQIFQGNLGVSFFYNRPVVEVLWPRLMNTILLVALATVFSTIVGIALGILAGWKRGTKVDVGCLVFGMGTYAIPTFWLGIVLILFVGIPLGLPASGIRTVGVEYTSFLDQMSDILRHLALPVLTLSFWYFGEYAYIMRSSMLDVMTEDYMLTAKAKGLRERVILRDHAVRNAMLPTITLVAINLGFIVAGAIQTETVFAWPGVGRMIYDSVSSRDYPLLQGSFLIIALSVVIANFIADITYGLVDPRVKY